MSTAALRHDAELDWLRATSARLAHRPPHQGRNADVPVAVSEDAAITAAFLRLLHSAPLDVAVDQSPTDRLTAQLREMLLMLADEPALAAVCLQAMLAPESAVKTTRGHIKDEVDRRIRTALGSGAWPEIVDLFEFALYGAVLQTSYGTTLFGDAADRLDAVVDIVLT